MPEGDRAAAPQARGTEVRVAYVAGWGRSGSTLLARMIGALPDAIFVGESRDLWQRGGVENRSCSCGHQFYDCPFWTVVGETAFGGWDAVDFDRMLHLRAVTDKPWSFFLNAVPDVSRRYRDSVLEYVDVLQRLFEAFRQVAGASTVVDSSKTASFAMLLRLIPGLDLRVIHLVRDSRGIAYSWQKQRPRLDKPGSTAQMLRYKPTASALRYTGYNLQAEGLRRYANRYVRLRYEDLMGDPVHEIRRVTRAVGLRSDAEALAFVTRDSDGYAARLPAHHAVAANPSRHESGAISLRMDDDWRSAMDGRTKMLVSAMTAPLLQAYGYRPFSGHPLSQ